ncbi:MAG: elongation factor G [Pirellulales bacterium]|nr:elongation factor G [Pirellulales bacterium]
MAVEPTKLRNIGIIAHIDAGKTTLTERMLFYCGFSHKVGEVDKGTTVTDFDPEEQQRGITIQSACVTFPYKDVRVNLIDTPGHVDFTAEVERSLRVLDGGVVVFSAREGVEAQSETVWRQADKYHVPRLAFINKMDREGVDFLATFNEIEQRLDARPIAVTLPVGAGPPHVRDAFRGVIDLVAMKLLVFTTESQGAVVQAEPVPETLRDEAGLWRSQMLDQLSLFSDELTACLLAEEQVPEDLIHCVLRQATLHDMIVPVFCGSALDGIGVQPLLDGVARYLPSPRDMPPVEGVDPQCKTEAKLLRKPDLDEPFCGLVFKIQADRHGDLHYVRVYSGQMKANSRVLNAGKDKKENVPQLWQIQADRRTQIDSVSVGDIVGVVGLRHSVTGDTLCDPKHPILLESIVFPETVISMAIEPESSTERKKLADVLEMMKRQDPTFHAVESVETGQTLISGMGELHLEVIKHRLLREFKLNVRVHHPRVSYRETIKGSVQATGTCHRSVGGQTLFAELDVQIEPFEGCRPITVAVGCGDALPAPLLAAAVETLRQEAEGGGQLGFPLMNVRLTVRGGRFREGESNDVAFRVAASDAYNTALREAGIVLLEPIMHLEIMTPEEYLGDFVSDLQKRRAIITHTHNRGRNTVIEAQAPLSELFGYSSAMRGLSQGRATCSMEPSTYGPAPPGVLESFM